MAYMTSLPFDLILTILCVLHSLEGTLANYVPYLNPVRICHIHELLRH